MITLNPEHSESLYKARSDFFFWMEVLEIFFYSLTICLMSNGWKFWARLGSELAAVIDKGP